MIDIGFIAQELIQTKIPVLTPPKPTDTAEEFIKLIMGDIHDGIKLNGNPKSTPKKEDKNEPKPKEEAKMKGADDKPHVTFFINNQLYTPLKDLIKQERRIVNGAKKYVNAYAIKGGGYVQYNDKSPKYKCYPYVLNILA